MLRARDVQTYTSLYFRKLKGVPLSPEEKVREEKRREEWNAVSNQTEERLSPLWERLKAASPTAQIESIYKHEGSKRTQVESI